MTQTNSKLSEKGVFDEIVNCGSRSPPVEKKVTNWKETMNKVDLLDPNRRSASICRWSLDEQSITSSCKARREAQIERSKREPIDRKEEEAKEKERMKERERREEEERNRKRVERKQQKQSIMGKDNAFHNVQDRSKSKAARIREDAKRYTRRERLEDHCDASHSVESVLKDNSRKRKAEDRREIDKGPVSFGKILEPFLYEKKNRPRIVLTQKPRVNQNQGIFAQGTSSADHHVNYSPIHPKKKLSRPKSESSLRSTVNLDTGCIFIPREASQSHESDLESTESRANAAARKFEEYDKAERGVKRILRTLQKNKEKARVALKHSKARKTTAVSNADSDKDHSAYSIEKRKHKRHRPSAHEDDEGICEKTVRSEMIECLEKSPAEAISKDASFDDGMVTPVIPLMGPPPLLAFNGNRPDQHVNAWRGQHTWNEPDTIQMQKEMQEAGGINMRARESIVNTTTTRQLPKEYFGPTAPSVHQWEVMPATSPAGRFVEEDDLYNQDEIPRVTMPATEVLNPTTIAGNYDFNADYRDEPWFDAVYADPSMHQQQHNLAYGYHHQLEDITFDPYMMYEEEETRHGHRGERLIASDWFDQDYYQDEGEWHDKVSDANQFEQSKAVTPTVAPSVSYHDIRMATQPTEEDLNGFWKPQL